MTTTWHKMYLPSAPWTPGPRRTVWRNQCAGEQCWCLLHRCGRKAGNAPCCSHRSNRKKSNKEKNLTKKEKGNMSWNMNISWYTEFWHPHTLICICESFHRYLFRLCNSWLTKPQIALVSFMNFLLLIVAELSSIIEYISGSRYLR